MSQLQPQVQTALFNVTTSGTTFSNAIGINNAGRLSLMVAGSKISSGNGAFSVQVSNDVSLGWSSYYRLTSNVANTNAQTDTRISQLVLSTSGTNFLFFPPGDTFAYMRVAVAITTDGRYDAVLYID